VVGALATLYAAAMLLAGGPKFLLLSALLYAPGTLLYVATRREQGLPLFSARERALFALLCVAAVAALVALASGALTI
jgi:arginine:ornithine antiporter/lysine permease